MTNRGKVFSEMLTGETYGKLTVLKELPSEVFSHNGRTKRMVLALCECGREVAKGWSNMKYSTTLSCGMCPRKSKCTDLSGMAISRLIVQNREDIPEKKGVYWDCLCSCGRVCSYSSNRLINKTVHNCGKCASSTQINANYIGSTVVTTQGYLITLLGFKGRGHNIRYLLKFNDDRGTLGECSSTSFVNGTVENPYHKTVVGIGYLGEGTYVTKVKSERHTTEYEYWCSMMKRCYSGLHSSYKRFSVCKEWHNFQVFAAWWDSNPYGKLGWQLDKDLLIKNNLIYSPTTCVFIPSKINGFIKRYRLNDLPLGVDEVYSKAGEVGYRSQGCEDGNVIGLGYSYDIPEDAFSAYKEHKEDLAKLLALKWEGRIEHKAFSALYNYNVDIED